MTIANQRRGKTAASVLITAFALTIGGCSVGLDYKTPQTKAPEQFGEGAATQPSTQPVATADLAHYWKSFNDPELDQLIDRAVKNNNTLLQAEVRVRQARAQVGIAWGNEFPTLSANANATR